MKTIIQEAALEQHVAVLGKTGSGKTSTAKLIVEQVVPRGARVCVLDPIKSDWWGITSSADGKKPGLPFHILGGPHGHVPLHSGAGKAIGELVGSGKLPLSIVDMADFEAGGVQRFFVDFAPALLRSMRGVLYLVWEEAHEYAPKERSGFEKENMAIHFAKKIATAGRSKGIRLIVATQATQLLHNRVLGSCETMVVHRFTAPADQDPVIKWLKANTTKAEVEQVAGSLSKLVAGEAWVVSGEAQVFERMKFPRIHTYDNSATPTDNDHQHQVKTAPVDQDALRSIIGHAVEEAEANDPKLLRVRISDLERELKKGHAGGQPDMAALHEAQERGRALGRADTLQGLMPALTKLQTLSSALLEQTEALNADARRMAGASAVQRIAPERTAAVKHSDQFAALRKSAGSAPSASGTVKFERRAERQVLTVLALYPNGRSVRQTALLAGYAHSGGGFRNALGVLRSAGYIEGRGDSLKITPAGVDALGPVDPLPRGRDLQTYWLGQLDRAAERSVLQVLIDAYPDSVPVPDIAAKAGYEAGGGGFRNALGKLRSLELINGRGEMKASAELFE